MILTSVNHLYCVLDCEQNDECIGLTMTLFFFSCLKTLFTVKQFPSTINLESSYWYKTGYNFY